MKNILMANLVCLFLILFITAYNYGQIVVIDAGHGYNNNCSNGDGRSSTEINTNYEVSIKLRDLLEGSYPVYLTRESNDCGSWIEIDERADIANFVEADLLLSIHCNAGGGTGTETFYCEVNDPDVIPDINFAETVQEEMVYYGEWTDRRVVEDNSYLGYHLGVLSQSDATSCLNEIGFVDNTNDEVKLLSDEWRDEFAFAYAVAIANTPTGICETCPPYAPRNFSARIVGTNIVLSWDTYTDLSANGLQVVRNDQSLGNSLPRSQTSYTHVNGVNSLPAVYKIYAFNSYGSSYSNPVSVIVSQGIISSNTTWNGAVYVNTNVTINNGATLTINPGTNITFTSGKSLTVNGVINAIGIAAQPISFFPSAGTTHSSWGSIKLNGSGASNSKIKYANVQYGTRIEVINASNIEIKNCSILNTYDGIRFSGSTGSILNNIITTNSAGHGIIIENASTATCNRNTVEKTSSSKSGVGILFRASSGGYIWQNDLAGWDWGVGAIYGSSPHFRINPLSSQTRSNRIRNCNYGVRIYENSFPVIGGPSMGYGYSSIYSNLTKQVYFTSGGQLSAYATYWGGGAPTSSMFYLGSGCSIITNNWLSSDPWSGLAKVSGDLASADQANTVTTSNEEIYKGFELRDMGKYKEAKDFFISYITKHPENQAAYVELYNCYNEETADDIISFFSSLPNKAAKEQKLLLSYLLLKQSKIELAKKLNNSLISENLNSRVSASAKISNIYIALYNDNDLNSAVAMLNDVFSKPGLSTSLELVLVHQAIESYANINGIKNINIPSVPKLSEDYEENQNENFAEKIETTLPKKYELSVNYPNPFNPATVIRYALPNNSRVKMEVFNILGEMITTLVNDIKPAGYYDVTFSAGTNVDGSNLASGIYIYRITANSLETGEQFVKSAQMLLLK